MAHTILILIYVFCCYISYKFMQKAHYHEKGRWTHSKPNHKDVVFIFIPIFNFIFAFDYFLGFWKKEEYRDEMTFFKPKNK